MLTGRLVVAAALLSAVTTTANAQETDWNLLPEGLTANVAFTNDYVFRGFTQTQEDIALQGSLEYTRFGFYAGTWASNVKFGIPGEGKIEWDVYGGYRGAFDQFTYDVGAIARFYPGTPANLDYDWWEISGKVGYDFDLAMVSAGIAYTPDFFGGLDSSLYYSGQVSVPVRISGLEGASILGSIGRQDMKAPFADIMDYSFGVSYAWKWFTTEVRYTDTDASAGCRDVCDSRVFVKVSRSF